MKILILFDNTTKTDTLLKRIKRRGITQIDLFPLTGNLKVTDEVYKDLKSSGPYVLNRLNSAKLIDESIDLLRQNISKWSAGFGKQKIKNRTIIDWFKLPKHHVSSWWFSLLSEKNNLKTDAFLHIAQINTIKRLLNDKIYDCFIISIADAPLQRSIQNLAKKHGKHFETIPERRQIPFKDKRKYMLKNLGIFGNIFVGVYVLLRFIKRGYSSKRLLSHYSKRLPNSENLLFVSYYPAVEKESVLNGEFKNRYALPLQNMLMETNTKITWLMMYVPMNGYSYDDAVRMADTFIQRGERIFLLEEFLSIKVLTTLIYFWVRQIFHALFLLGSLRDTCLWNDPLDRECLPIIKSLWMTSFCGPTGIESILYYLLFNRAINEVPYIQKCIYYCEMQAWEKALNASLKQVAPHIYSIGFQHTSISRNYFHYFYDKNEVKSSGRETGIPLPKVLACNGDITCSFLSKSNYPGLKKVEAMRQMYLDRILSYPLKPKREKPLMLVAGSMDEIELRNMLFLLNAAFPKTKNIDVWFKSHSAMPLGSPFEDLLIEFFDNGFKIKNGNLSNMLEMAWIVLVPSSTVAIEALAFGCEVIVPIFPDSINMSPLAGFKDYYHQVTTADELSGTMNEIVSGHTLKNAEKYRKFIKKYWFLEHKMSRWRALLSEV